MSKKLLLKKTCSIYASDMHLATMIFPYVRKELEEEASVKAIFEKNMEHNIQTIIEHTHMEETMKQKMKEIDWKQTNIEKIKNILKEIEKELNEKDKINIFVAGAEEFIDKINELLDIWTKVNFEKIAMKGKTMNIINCYAFEEANDLEQLINKHEYMLKTAGIEEIYDEETLKKAN